MVAIWQPRGAGAGMGQHQVDGDIEATRRCIRDAWCRGRVIANGEISAAATPRNFCDACVTEIGTCLADLPRCWWRAYEELGQLGGGRKRTGPRPPAGSRLPMLPGPDVLMRSIVECLLSWDDRIRQVKNLSHANKDRGRRDAPAEILKELARAANLLGEFMGPLLALDDGGQQAEMMRWHDGGGPEEMILWLGNGTIDTAKLGGTAAGLEILALHGRARGLLGETRPQPETLDGIPCKRCEAMSLERAEPPSDPTREAMWSRCAGCLDTMTLRDFRAWVKWYSEWADKAGLTCRRCAAQRHDECSYTGCGCLACAYAASELAAQGAA